MTARRASVLVGLAALLLAGCATAPRSPAQAHLNACLRQADRDVLTEAQLEPNGRFSYRYFDAGGSGPEREKFVACMQKRTQSYPTVR
jgi:outer membrane biogenesis lipoprotein LolB